MIKKEFVNYLADKLKIERRGLIEKDLLLQSILIKLMKNHKFKEDFVFKGGTCLIKCYLGYYRFSEDLDFSYLCQKEFRANSEKQIRKELSIKINWLMHLLKEITNKLELDFKAEKKNDKYVEFGGSNRFVTFKIWYNSSILNMPSFIKIQINFVETFVYKIRKSEVKCLIDEGFEKDIKFLFPEYAFLLEKVSIKAYDISEILVEKIRAILTRKGIKARDFIDVFLITRKAKLDLIKLDKQILDKTRFMLKYRKYRENLKKEIDFVLGEEEKLLLKPIGKDFERFVQEFKPFLSELVKKLE